MLPDRTWSDEFEFKRAGVNYVMQFDEDHHGEIVSYEIWSIDPDIKLDSKFIPEDDAMTIIGDYIARRHYE